MGPCRFCPSSGAVAAALTNIGDGKLKDHAMKATSALWLVAVKQHRLISSVDHL